MPTLLVCGWDWESGELVPRHAQRVVRVVDKRANGSEVLCSAVHEEGRGGGYARSSIEQESVAGRFAGDDADSVYSRVFKNAIYGSRPFSFQTFSTL